MGPFSVTLGIRRSFRCRSNINNVLLPSHTGIMQAHIFIYVCQSGGGMVKKQKHSQSGIYFVMNIAVHKIYVVCRGKITQVNTRIKCVCFMYRRCGNGSIDGKVTLSIFDGNGIVRGFFFVFFYWVGRILHIYARLLCPHFDWGPIFSNRK